MASSPTQRTMTLLRKCGHIVALCEHWNSFARVRQDLLKFIDVLYLSKNGIVGVQCTSAANHAARRAKILAEPNAVAWLSAGGKIQIWSWAKKGPRGKRKKWECRVEEIGVIEDTCKIASEC